MAVGDAHAFPSFLTPVLTQLSFQCHRLLFSHGSAELRGEKTPEREFASIGDPTHNHQVVSPTCSPLRHPGRLTSVEGHWNNKQQNCSLSKLESASSRKLNVSKLLPWKKNRKHCLNWKKMQIFHDIFRSLLTQGCLKVSRLINPLPNNTIF